MSFSGHALLWLHVAAAIFTIGPVTAAIMSTPRSIRKRRRAAVEHLYRTTRIYTAAALLVLIFGLILTQIRHDFSKWWVSVSITLFVVAIVLLVLILRDQRKAISALAAEEKADGGTPGRYGESEAGGLADGEAADQPAPAPASTSAAGAAAMRVAAVEQARIASMSGVVALIWLVTLGLMVWK